MFEQVQRQQHAPVVVVGSQGAADLLVATLQVHGVAASTNLASVYPSIDWVEGVAVSVAASDLELARALVRDLGHEPLSSSGGG